MPRTWQLIRKRPGGAEETLETAVACFDVAEDGRILFSNGRQITETTPDGRKTLAAEADLVQEVEFLR